MMNEEQQKLEKTSRIVATVCLSGILLIPILYALVWFGVIESDAENPGEKIGLFIASAETGVWQRLIGLAIALVPQAALLYGVWQLRLFFLEFGQGQIFSGAAAVRMGRFARALFAYAVLDFFATALLTGLATFANPPGERILEFEIGAGDVKLYFLIILFYALTRVIAEGIRIARENSEFL